MVAYLMLFLHLVYKPCLSKNDLLNRVTASGDAFTCMIVLYVKHLA